MADAVSPQTLSTLIGSIYDCALDPGLWEQTLGDVRDALDCQTAILTLTDLRRGDILISKSVGMDPLTLREIGRHEPELNAQLSEVLESWPSLDEPYVISRHLPQSYAATSPYIQEGLKPRGLVDAVQYFLMRTRTHFSGLAFARHERQGLITEREIELGGLLLPHVRRAVTISNVLDARTIERARMAETLDTLSYGVVLTDGRCAILHANRAAEHMLRSGGPIDGAHGILGVKVSAAARELRAAIKLAAGGEAEIGKTGLAIRLTALDMPPVFAHVLPMAGSDARTRLKPEAVAAVFVGAPEGQDATDALAAAFELTPAETRVLASLLGGRTIAETAVVLRIAATTAKTHVRNIFSKTGVARQAELMRLAARVTPPAKASSKGHAPASFRTS